MLCILLVYVGFVQSLCNSTLLYHFELIRYIGYHYDFGFSPILYDKFLLCKLLYILFQIFTPSLESAVMPRAQAASAIGNCVYQHQKLQVGLCCIRAGTLMFIATISLLITCPKLTRGAGCLKVVFQLALNYQKKKKKEENLSSKIALP